MSNVYAIDWNIGAHISFSQKIASTVKEAINNGMYTVQFFMGNPKSFKRQIISEEDIKNTQILTKKFPMHIFSHFPYVANFAGKSSVDGLAWNGNSTIDLYLMNIITELEYELYILSKIGNGVIIHPGSNPDREKGHITVSKTLNKIKFPEGSMLILENCAGEGNKLCSTLEELKIIFENVDKDKRKNIGICIDTAHIWGQGDYDLRDIKEVDRLFNDFQEIIGMEYFKVLHLNDSEVLLGSKKDRHACIGAGYIWKESFDSLLYLLNKCTYFNIPMVLETHSSDIITIASLSEYENNLSFVCTPCVEQCFCCIK